jgi:hypothetical protein
MHSEVLHCGSCERLKAATHGVALGTALLCATYNFAAWIVRRQRHLAINALVYAAAVAWEAEHVQHHLAQLPRRRAETIRTPGKVKAA